MTKKETEGEKRICHGILLVTIKDLLQDSDKKSHIRLRRLAKKWFDTQYEYIFGFENVIHYLYGENIEVDEFRHKFLNALMNIETEDIDKILDKIEDENETGQDESEESS